MAGIEKELANYVDPNLWIRQTNINSTLADSKNNDRNNSNHNYDQYNNSTHNVGSMLGDQQSTMLGFEEKQVIQNINIYKQAMLTPSRAPEIIMGNIYMNKMITT